MAAQAYTAAIIGAGAATSSGRKGGGHQIGYTHAQAYKSVDRVKLIAAADINPENLSAFQQRFDVPQGFADYREMLARARPDIVSICTYVGLHAEMIEAAARAGAKGIFCEKPFVQTPGEIDRVRRVVDETGVKLIVAHVRRYRPAFQRARDLFNDGTVGQPVMCISGIEGWDLSEWGSHWLDMFRFLNNDRPVQWVMGQARVRDFRGYGHQMEEHAAAYFQFDDGAKALLDGGTGLRGGGDMVLIGTAGQIRVSGESKLTIYGAKGETVEDSGQAYGGTGAWEQCWTCAVRDLASWIDGGDVPLVGLPRVLASSELNVAAYVSMVRGDRIDLPMDPADYADITEWPVNILSRRWKDGQGT